MIASVGKSLIERRRALGLCLDDVAHASRVSRQNLRWLEEDELSHFPNLAYALAFLRFYGAVLELDVEELTARARRQFAAAQEQRARGWRWLKTFGAVETRRHRSRILEKVGTVLSGAALSIILAAAGLAAIERFSPEDPAKPAISALMLKEGR